MVAAFTGLVGTRGRSLGRPRRTLPDSDAVARGKTADAPKAAGSQRFAFIHALRGIAALLVVWSHLSGFWLLSNAKASTLQNVWQVWIVQPFHVFQNGGHLGVVLFFLISGFIITHTALREDRRSFFIKRMMRIFPPLFFAVLVSWLLLRLAAATGTTLLGVNGGGVWHWLAATFMLDGFVPGGSRALDVSWTLVIELLFYAMTFFLLGSARRNALRSIWIMTGLWVGLVLVSFNWPVYSSTQNALLSIYVGFLLLGRIIYFWNQKIIGTASAIIAAVLVSTLYAVFTDSAYPGFLLKPGGWGGVEPAVSYIYAIIIFVGMMLLSPKRTVQPFKLLGDVSYSLYLLHIPVGITVLNLLAKTGVSNSLNTVIAILVSIAVSYGAYRLVEMPTQRLARWMLKRTDSRREITPATPRESL